MYVTVEVLEVLETSSSILYGCLVVRARSTALAPRGDSCLQVEHHTAHS